MSGWQEFTGLNRGYVLELYEKYRQDPASVDPETRALFESWTPPAEETEAPLAVAASIAAGALPLEKIVGAVNLAESIRRYGHLAAQLDPLGDPPASATRRSSLPRTASPTTICGGCPRAWFPDRSRA